jgi:nitrogen fixation protein FixH
MTTKPLTGLKVFLITATAFGVIIAVNLTLAFQAVRTFPGLEVKNSYVASQSFDRDRADQLSLGWTVSLDYDGGVLSLTLTDEGGQPVRPQINSAILGRATHTGEDRAPEFRYARGAFVAEETLGRGNWNLRLEAQSENGVTFRQRIPLHVRAGE